MPRKKQTNFDLYKNIYHTKQNRKWNTLTRVIECSIEIFFNSKNIIPKTKC